MPEICSQITFFYYKDLAKAADFYERIMGFELADDQGLLVIGVQPGFPGAVAGLSRGDIINKINQQPIADLEAAKHQYSTYLDKPEPTLFEARRNRSVSLFILKP